MSCLPYQSICSKKMNPNVTRMSGHTERTFYVHLSEWVKQLQNGAFITWLGRKMQIQTAFLYILCSENDLAKTRDLFDHQMYVCICILLPPDGIYRIGPFPVES